ncbi:hypothetical protein DTO271G3_1401 [Paecilomyces variotii]|nr:hypothetical protein DTO271G3_1401 [Paecilomyces variotii]
MAETFWQWQFVTTALHNSQLGTRDNGENDNNDGENGNNDDNMDDRQLLTIGEQIIDGAAKRFRTRSRWLDFLGVEVGVSRFGFYVLSGPSLTPGAVPSSRSSCASREKKNAAEKKKKNSMLPMRKDGKSHLVNEMIRIVRENRGIVPCDACRNGKQKHIFLFK